jgi:hypothetical protein
MKHSAAAILLLLLAGCQTATLEAPEAPEQSQPAVPTLSGPALQTFIAGKSLRYNYYGAVSTYRADGTYAYRDYEVRDAGTWAISGDTVCIAFDGGGRRCDRFALIGEDHVRIEEGGRHTKVDGVEPA